MEFNEYTVCRADHSAGKLGNKMKNIIKVSKFVAIGVLAIATTACSTTNQRSVETWQNKVWEGVVVAQFLDTTKFAPTDRDFLQSSKYDDKVHHGMRTARVHISSGWDSVMANAMVPDSVEFADIPKGTIVEMVTETGPAMDYSKERYTRILRVVCKKNDDACIDVEAKAKRIRAVIGENNGSDYGQTFKRRVTKEEFNKFN